MSNYFNPHLTSVSEFEDDLKRLSYILLLLNRYKKSKEELNLNLILNHIVILTNCFGPEAAKNLILYKTDKEHSATIRTIMYYLKIYGSINIDYIDTYVLERLKEL